ncbi:hypothetical protein [Algoriphagus hitonicola]|uniref:Uncharacterized protein n=1 Tax=Algoriphagus hitonicola TaxID=435880 RepID=A0A1I2P6I9_9BACT|nr:hypothetical protein [Algoriphagus hitonicola]SFG11123.1 hypothetical protein SAMN04487988_101446 [Algoriphagus hitonicola]
MIRVFFLLIWLPALVLVQHEKTFLSEYIYVDGLAFRQQGLKSIFEKYGPIKRSPTDYECGFHSNEEQGKTYYQFIYPQITWIGSAEDGRFLADRVIFDQEGQIKWVYFKEAEFSGKSTQAEGEDFMGKNAEPIQIYGREEEELFCLGGRFTHSDDGFFFLFKQGKLIELQYWSPC